MLDIFLPISLAKLPETVVRVVYLAGKKKGGGSSFRRAEVKLVNQNTWQAGSSGLAAIQIKKIAKKLS